jgi:hypothetical protein
MLKLTNPRLRRSNEKIKKVYKKGIAIILMGCKINIRYKSIFILVFVISLLGLISAPIFYSVSWNMTEVLAGQPVRLNVNGALEGHEISFQVFERDAGGTNDSIIDLGGTNPPNIMYGSPNTYSTWISEYHDDTDEGQTNPPEYYFIARAVGYSASMTSSTADADMLKVYICGDGICTSAYEENCSTCSQDCGACAPVCGDGTCNGAETCLNCSQDCGACAPVCGDGTCNGAETCLNCSQDCGACAPICGDGTCNGAETCLNCSQDCGVCPEICELTSAVWSVTEILAGQPVKLNLEGTDCNGETITFEVREDDFLDFLVPGDFVANPSNIVFGSPNTYGTWIVKWVDDEGGLQTNPPEYYFIATVEGASESITSSRSYDYMLKVEEIIQCMGVNYCSNYLTESICESDMCGVGEDSAPNSISCGETFNPITECNESTNCECYWDDNLNVCESDWDSESVCPTETLEIGTCSYTETSQDTCEDDGMLTRSLSALWEWSPLNPEPYSDPLGKESECIDLQEVFSCPASTQVPFFGIYNIIIATIIIVLVYVGYYIHKKKKNFKKK